MPSNTSQSMNDNQHTQQQIPYEWAAIQVGEETVIVWDKPDGTIKSYRAVQLTHNVRVTLQFDAILYDGFITTPYHNDNTDLVQYQHTMAAEIAAHTTSELFDDPVVCLEEIHASRNIGSDNIAKPEEGRTRCAYINSSGDRCTNVTENGRKFCRDEKHTNDNHRSN